MGYKVITAFTDLQDNNHVYRVGDEFPRHGFGVSAERVAELASTNNRRGVALIIAQNAEKQAETKEKPKADKRVSNAKKTAKKAKE